MWIEELDNGKYKYVERYTDPLTGKQRKMSLTHTKKNARVEKEMFIKLQEKIEKKSQRPSADITFKELSEKWLVVYKQQVRESTYRNRKSYANRINRYIGHFLLNDLNAPAINAMILDFLESGLSNAYVKMLVVGIRLTLSFGVKYGYLKDNNIVHGIEIPKINVNKKDTLKYLEKKELEQLVRQLETKGHAEIARLCLIQTYTGMRFGELSAIDYKKHIDFKNKTILIERTWYEAGRKFQPTKSGESRLIHFNGETEKILKEQIQFTKLKVLQKRLDRDKHLLFINVNSNPFSIPNTNSHLKRHAKIPGKKITSHIFRHTFITLMVEQGVELSLIAKHVGHTDTKMVEKVYSHFTEKMDADLKDAINDFSISI